MRKYYRVVLGGKNYYRQYDETLDCYERESLTEDDVVENIIHINQSHVEEITQ